jgi:hypothetical protein
MTHLNTDIYAIRRNFPGLEHGIICLNNSSGTIAHKAVIDMHVPL